MSVPLVSCCTINTRVCTYPECPDVFCTWAGVLYATSIDNLQSSYQGLSHRVEATAIEERRIAGEVASAHADFAYPLGASLVQQEKSGIPAGDTIALDDAATAFQEQLEDATRELDLLWEEWGRS